MLVLPRRPGTQNSSTRFDEPRSPAYVAALDGLRAFAVIAVVVYHFAPTWLPAGFLGVDVFFVVSGFLITRLLLAEDHREHRIRLRRFWSRRVRRLLPGVTAMLAVVALAALLRSTDAQLHDLRGQFVATLLYVANWCFIFGHNSYFASTTGPSPLLHTWSLAVEEQFYVLFPLLLLGGRRLFRRSRAALMLAFVAGALLSSALMAFWYDSGQPSRVYYGTDTHAMGLLLGAALCVWTRADDIRPRSRHLADGSRTLAATIGLVTVLVVMRIAGEGSDWLFRGGFLAFSFVCCVVIAGVSRAPRSALARVLSVPALVAVGLRSYSLYLWHWPVRVFVDEPTTHLSGYPLLVVRLVLLVTVAELSYRLVERPLRTGILARRHGTVPAIAFSAVAAVAVLALVAAMPATAIRPTQTIAFAVPSAPATASAAPAPLRVDVFGDSTAFVFVYKLHDRLQDVPEVSPAIAGSLGCSLVSGDYYAGRERIGQPDYCAGWQDRWRELLAQRPPQASVLMTGAWDILDHRPAGKVVRFGTDAWHALVKSSVEEAVDILRSAGAPVYIMEAPCYTKGDWDVPSYAHADAARVSALDDIFHEVATERSGVQVLPFRDYVCPNGTLLGTIDGTSMWDVDGVHLSADGAVATWHWLAARLRSTMPPH